MTQNIRINGVEWLAYPTSFVVEIDDVLASSAGLLANGKNHRPRIATKRNISVSFPMLTDNQIANVLNSIDDVFFDVFYPDPHLGAWTTRRFSAENKTAPSFDWASGRWSGLSFDLVEE